MKAQNTASDRWWELLNRSPALRRREFATLVGLVRLFEGRARPWQVGNAGFEARVPLQERDVDGIVVYKIHALGWEERRLRFHASVTVWPRRMRSQSVWFTTCQRSLRRYGYRGEWHRGKWRVGDFWKRLEGLRALRVEVKRLERWTEQPPWRRRTVG